MNTPSLPEKRLGKTGIWEFVLKTPEGKILATSEWGTNYEFNEKQWLDLPQIREAMNPDHGSRLWFYESETEPPKEGPILWFRPSDGAHFSRGDSGWVQYTPMNIEATLKVGESVRVNVPPLPTS